jgi:hypothetical protein
MVREQTEERGVINVTVGDGVYTDARTAASQAVECRRP